MEKLSIEQKAKRYDEAINVAKSKIKNDKDHVLYEEDITDIFPALKESKESEDERIRKELIEYIKDQQSSFISAPDCRDKYEEEENNKYNSWIAWLEKQGEQKPTLPKWKYKKDHTPLLRDSIILNKYGCVAKSPAGALVSDVWVMDYAELAKLPKEEIGKQGEPADKVKPKFKIGDWVVNNNGEPQLSQVISYSWPNSKIKRVTNNLEIFVNKATLDKQYHLWTIQDAKPGDVLYFNNDISGFHSIGLFKRLASKNEINGGTYRCYTRYGGFNEENRLEIARNNDELCHCGTEACPATEEQRYTLFAKMKEAGYEFDFEKKRVKKIEQKPAEWSEEDKRKINRIYSILRQAADTHAFSTSCRLIGDKECIELQDWLKSLRPQNQWKPSEEQMEALANALSLAKNCGEESAFDLRTLHEQLKKLKE